MGGGGPPLAALNAARAAIQISDVLIDALADAVPAEVCTMSSTISFVLGGAGTVSSIL